MILPKAQSVSAQPTPENKVVQFHRHCLSFRKTLARPKCAYKRFKNAPAH